jgi:methylated-DNA-[protein]-cysteine S-methyltransferase
METLITHIYHSPIGQMSISAEEGCITELIFVEEDATTATLALDEDLPSVIHQCVDELIEYFAGTRKHFTVPINQEGTAFQQKVWKELYGKNKIAIIVPCHRIIGTDQSLVGYAWGKARKRWLLQHEFRLALGVQTLF